MIMMMMLAYIMDMFMLDFQHLCVARSLVSTGLKSAVASYLGNNNL